ncbi:MAG: hypothetical protein R2720_08305 [Candidatus Nanopelagicales bacterium]
MDKPSRQEPDQELITKITAGIQESGGDAAVVKAAATAVAQAVADIDPVFVAEASERGDGSLRVDIWETASVAYGDLLPDDYQESWEQESGSSWQGGASSDGELQDLLAAAVDIAVKHLG